MDSDRTQSRRELTILIVENDADMRGYLSRCLQPLEARILEVGGGREALKLLRTDSQVDLVISDVVMPGLSGLQLVRQLDEDPELSDLPVLLVTGAGEDVEQSGRTVLRKPFSGSLLRVYVEELINQDRGRGLPR